MTSTGTCFGLFTNTSKPAAIRSAEYAVQLLQAAHAKCCVEPSVAVHFSQKTREYVREVELDQFGKFADVIISFGGDGTMLAAARSFLDAEIPIMGINLGHLGFLAEFAVDELESAITSVLKGDYLLEDRFALHASFGDREAYALNDFVVHQSEIGRMISLRASVDDETVAEYRADALIVSTPTGSSAYNLSAGGPLIAPSCSVVCLTPVSPHALTFRPLVVPDTAEIRLEESSGRALCDLIADGVNIGKIDSGGVVTIRRSDQKIKLLKRAQRSYFDILRTKLLWAADATGSDAGHKDS